MEMAEYVDKFKIDMHLVKEIFVDETQLKINDGYDWPLNHDHQGIKRKTFKNSSTVTKKT